MVCQVSGCILTKNSLAVKCCAFTCLRGGCQFAYMEAKTPVSAIRKIMLQAAFDRTESDFIPRDFVLGKQPDLQAFLAGKEVRIKQPGAEQHVYLVDIRQAVHRI